MPFGFLGDLLGMNGGDPAIDAAGKNRDILRDYKSGALTEINAGADQAGGALGEARDLYGNITARGNNAASLYDNAIGLNGAAGNDAARSAFTESPGYQFQMDQGLQALDRGAAARGSFQSGGTGIDELGYAQGLAGQDFNGWLDRLNGVAGNQALGTAGEAGALGDLASLYTGTAGAKVGVLDNATSGLLGANNQQAEGESANKEGMSNLFGSVAGAVTSFGKGKGWF